MPDQGINEIPIKFTVPVAGNGTRYSILHHFLELWYFFHPQEKKCPHACAKGNHIICFLRRSFTHIYLRATPSKTRMFLDNIFHIETSKKEKYAAHIFIHLIFLALNGRNSCCLFVKKKNSKGGRGIPLKTGRENTIVYL